MFAGKQGQIDGFWAATDLRSKRKSWLGRWVCLVETGTSCDRPVRTLGVSKKSFASDCAGPRFARGAKIERGSDQGSFSCSTTRSIGSSEDVTAVRTSLLALRTNCNARILLA